jgi:hypothetical protein
MPALGDTVGRMTITLIHNGTSRPSPEVTFDDVGLFTAGLMGDYLTHFATEIERAQVRVRHAQRAAQRQEA